MKNGQVSCWGNNLYGEVGAGFFDGNTASSRRFRRARAGPTPLAPAGIGDGDAGVGMKSCDSPPIKPAPRR